MRSERPTILQVIPELDTGGAELSTIEITEAIAMAGGRALVLSEGGRMASRIAAVGGEFIPFWAATKNPARILLNAKRIARLITDEKIDLVHARSRAPAWSARLATTRTKTSFITTYHGAYNETNRFKKRYNSVMAAGELIIANSNYTAQLIQSRYGTPPEKIRVIYRGLDGSQFDPEDVSPARRTALRSKWHITPDTRVILQAARLSSLKGQAVVIAAAQRLQERGLLENTVVIFAGDAQGRSGYVRTLEDQISASGLQDKVRMVGHVDDIPAALSLAHAAIVASTKPETFGRTAIEAQAMACPVIATNIGAPPETVRAEPQVNRDQTTGWLVAPNNPEQLADALAQALALAPQDRTALGYRARQHVLDNFSLEDMRRKTLDVYDTVLGSRLAQSMDKV